ncbi:DUF4126 family protein [Marinibactrum halimedae]|uniref:DUF4126 domain-containing protein n=1 Tax=Marinibactrum halimedae TaxID=1444977 RepID=A0AA37WLX4_9GAMM|nr:DUF4126 family protein [Marinibactrum halimedae]MCD9460123.1 DUF4126 family protein [Marinibactrum halimedae]GLS26524.1 hypothetical protein GCM10007877_22400 [Marinibactrum halimedae]
MESYEMLVATIALTMGASWASGINLYATLLMLGLAGSTGNLDLPSDLEVLENPLVIGAAGIMYFVEFFVDKTPGVDSGWDTLHTFVRIPAGVLLAAGAVGEINPAMEVAAGILGGGLAATSHATKSGSRLLINTSPEPFSNWGASVTEDLLVIGGLWTALNHPVLFLILLIAFIALAVWMIPKLWRLLASVFRKLATILGFKTKRSDDSSSQNNSNTSSQSDDSVAIPLPHTQIPFEQAASLNQREKMDNLERLHQLYKNGVLTEEEFQKEKFKLLSNSYPEETQNPH